MTELRLPFDEPESSIDARIDARDRAARERAVDPRFNVTLEASAGTGKTRVLVDRYINLLRAGVDPANILAITFTRKAAAEMRERIVTTLRTAAARGEIPASSSVPGGEATRPWRELRDRLGDIAISTIDAFCLTLLREFPLEADLDPGFTMADETEVPRLVDEALDRALRICRSLAREDENVALAFAQLSERRVRAGLGVLLNRRIVAPAALQRFLASGPADLDVARACRRAVEALRETLDAMPGGLERFLETGPIFEPSFTLLARDLRKLADRPASDLPAAAFAADAASAPTKAGSYAATRGDYESVGEIDPSRVQAAFARVRDHFLTQDGAPRKRLDYAKHDFASEHDWKHHRDVVLAHADAVERVLAAYRRDLNVIVSRGIWRMFQVASTEYRRTLDAHAVLDFPDVLLRALGLLRQMDEFAQSRYRLESRYHHILVDEFQDTSRAQWELVSLLVQSWGEGEGLAHSGPLQPSIFVVGDRKQSIYGFRDADVAVLDEASRYLGGLRPRDGDTRRSISRSFRALPNLLAFVNDLCADIDKAPARRDRFRYDEEDRFPIDAGLSASAEASAEKPAAALAVDAACPEPGRRASAPGNAGHPHRSQVLGLVASDTPEGCAGITTSEIARLLAEADVRDRDTGVMRRARPGDVAILFRTRESHREFEDALERRGIPSDVYKGLGFFDADEIKDVLALLWYLADPLSALRAAALLRSRLVRLSDEGLRLLAPGLADALLLPDPPAAAVQLDARDARALAQARASTARWRALVDLLPPAELLDLVFSESAYGLELRGPRLAQARENLKKMRALVRRIQNRGYATLGRIAAHLDRLSAGDESNAVIDALDAVNLMTVHASKGLEFPIVFVVNLARGTGNRRDPVRVSAEADGRDSSVSVGDFQSEADEDHAATEREETKRLLYVAVTRARDRLYLGSVLKDGGLQPGRGSLADVLPPPLVQMFGEGAASAGGVATWTASGGATHEFRVCGDCSIFRLKPEATPEATPEARPEVTADPASDAASDQRVASGFSRKIRTIRKITENDFEPIILPPPTRRSILSTLDDGGLPAAGATGSHADRLIGTVVHRLLERFGLTTSPDELELNAAAAAILAAEGFGGDLDTPDVVRRATSAYASVCARVEVQALRAASERLHEVPFVMYTDEGVLRGSIDCLLRHPLEPGQPARYTVLEFKTGGPRPEHRRQLDLYRGAAELMFPGAQIDAVLVYG